MSTQPLSSPKPERGEDPADLEKRRTDYFLSLLSDPAVYDTLDGYAEGVSVEYLLAVRGNDG